MRDELAAMGETVADSELVKTTLHGFPKIWEVFVEGIIVDDIAASEDILGEIILYKTLRENIFVYFIMSAIYI